jgi:hypothetical protein
VKTPSAGLQIETYYKGVRDNPANREKFATAVADAAPEVDENVEVTVVEVDDRDAAEAALRDDEVDAWLHPTEDGWQLTSESSEQGSLTDVVRTVDPPIDDTTRDEWWAALLGDLSGEDVVAREVGPGTIEIEQLDEPTTWVHVTRDQWARYVAEHGWDQATQDLEATRSALWEEHTVLFRGRLCCSIRAELPPITQEEDDRSQGIPPDDGSMAGGYWVAVDARGQEHRFPEMPEEVPDGFGGVVRRLFDRLRRP